MIAMTLVYLVAAWLAGMLAASQSSSPPGFWLAMVGACILAAVLLRSSRRDRLILACLTLFALGAARFSFTQRPLPANHIGRYAGSGWLTLTGTLTAPPDPRDTHMNLRVAARQIARGDIRETVTGTVLVQAPLGRAYRYGDQLTVEGSLLLPPEFDDFSYRDYLARRGIYAVLSASAVEVVGHGEGKPWLAAIYSLRERASGVIRRLLPSPQAPLLNGILLGDESGIPADVREAFNRTGASHVIAISGANIAILLRALMGLLEPLVGRKRSVWLASGLIFTYAALVGGDPGVVRAAIMGTLALAAARSGRKVYGLTTLAFTVWLMSLHNPNVLWDVGFQLSVAATAGLVFFTDDLTRLLARVLGRLFPAPAAARLLGWLSEPLVVSVAAQIATTPLILYVFGRLSIASLLTNLFIVSLQPYIMITGWIALVTGLLAPGAGEVLAWGVWLPLTYMLRVIEALAGFSWASAEVRLSAEAVRLIYVALMAAGLSRMMHPEDRHALRAKVQRMLPASSAASAGVVIALLVWTMALRQPDGRLHLWFLDVGDSSAVLIETPRGAQILVDTGRSPARLQSALGRALPFADRGLDGLILMRADPSASGALAALFDRYTVGAVWLACAPGAAADQLAAVLDSAADRPAPTWLQRGQIIAVDDGVQIETVLLPSAESGALRVTYGDASFFLAFGFAAPEETALLASGYAPRSTVLQLAGGGHQLANTRRFLAAVQPQIAVAAVAAGNRLGLPHPAVIERLAQQSQARVYRTDIQGTLEFVTDGATVEVRPSR